MYIYVSEHWVYVFVPLTCAVAHRCELSLMYARRSCLPLSFLCVLKSPLLQTVWGAEMVDGEGCCVGGGGGRGSGRGGRPESIGSVMRWPGAR